MRLVYALACAGAALASAGCDLVTHRPPLGRDYGDPYALHEGVPVTVRPGLRLETPAIDPSLRLIAVVEYVGGCAEHTFRPEAETSPNGRTLLWLVHDGGGDTCRSVVRDTVAVELGAAYRPGPVALSVPGGGELVLAPVDGGN